MPVTYYLHIYDLKNHSMLNGAAKALSQLQSLEGESKDVMSLLAVLFFAHKHANQCDLDDIILQPASVL